MSAAAKPDQGAEATARPRLSVGLPVYNGERHLSEALDTLLAQTFGDFELIICDNASTDSTRQISEERVLSDSRVKYHLSPSNVGAAPNFNRSFDLARGDYFCWAAHDDLRSPDYFERCIAALDADQSVVLAYPKSTIIDTTGEEVGPYELKLATDSQSPSERFAELLRGHKCFEIFGVIRREALAATPRIGSYPHGDGVLLARLALKGRFAEVPNARFYPRRHAEQSMNMLGDYRSYAVWFDSRLNGKMLFPTWRIHWEFFTSILRGPIRLRERVVCLVHLSLWIARRWLLFVRDVAYHVRRVIKKYTRVDIHPLAWRPTRKQRPS